MGFTTQTAKQSEIATTASSLPRKLVGSETIIHTRRPQAWASLCEEDAAMLDFLRRAGDTSELSPEETIRRTLKLLSPQGRYERLLKVADAEPPRVRAMLGAIGEQLGKKAAALQRLRNSLNPFSRFDFGLLSGLPHAIKWQAKESSRMKLFEHLGFVQAVLRGANTSGDFQIESSWTKWTKHTAHGNLAVQYP